MTKSEYHKVVSPSKVVDKMVRETDGRVDTALISSTIRGEGKAYREQEVSLDELEIQDVENVDPSRASSDKGAIIVAGNGFIIDGRHRAAAAKARGEKSIRALVPISDMTPHKKVIAEAVAAGQPVPEAVKAEYGL